MQNEISHGLQSLMETYSKEGQLLAALSKDVSSTDENQHQKIFCSSILQLSDLQLRGLEPLDPALQIFRDADLESWYTPFEQVNRQAKIVIIGITPGKPRLLNGLREMKTRLGNGDSIAAALTDTKHVGAFSGQMRRHLVSLLHHVGMSAVFGLDTEAALFGHSASLLHSTSRLKNAVFYKGKNHNGTPDMVRQPILRRALLNHFAVEVAALQHAIFVPLGEKAAAAADFLASEGVLPLERVFAGLPQPSPANIERIHFFTGKS